MRILLNMCVILMLSIVLAIPVTSANEAHEEHSGHEHEHESEHEEHGLILTPQQRQEFSIQLSKAGPGVIRKTLDLTGEVIVEPNKLYHVVPRVAGVVQKVYKQLGDTVKEGDLLALLSSRELANAKAEFVAANSLLKLANSNLQRERKLYRGKITAQRQYLAAMQAQQEASIRQKAARQHLLALGLSAQEITQLASKQDPDLTRYELRAPADGIIIAKHASHGELLTTASRSFTIADLSQVWVNLTLYQKDLASVKTGQTVMLNNRFAPHAQAVTESRISWISPTLDEKTRSATARVILDNPDLSWRPGLFVTARVVLSQTPAKIVIPQTALQTVDGQSIVYVQHEEGEFEAQPVTLGQRDFNQVEILSGLKPGQIYVSQNAFTLKAQGEKGAFGHGHSH